MKIEWKLYLPALVLVSIAIWLFGDIGRVTEVDKELVRKIESNIAVCKERDDAYASMSDTGTEGVYYLDELEHAGNLARECHKQVVKQL